MENIRQKISNSVYERLEEEKNGKLVLVTAINPTPFRRRKDDSININSRCFIKNRKKSILALREPSLGPVFGIKGRSNRWRNVSNSSNGRYKFAFYR